MNWSLSKLGTFTKCRRRFLYSYIQHLKGTEQPRGARERGVDQHAHIERYFKDRTPLPVDLTHYKQWFDMLCAYEPIAEEPLAMLEGWMPGSWEDPKVWWKGVLDLRVRKPPISWVFDWKTGKVYPDHVDQRELYAIAVFVNDPEINEIEAWHVYIDLGKKVKQIFFREQLPALIAKWNGKLAGYMQALERFVPGEAETMFVTNPSYLCDYCPYSRNPCPH